MKEIKTRFSDCKTHGVLTKWSEWTGGDYETDSKKWSATQSGEGYSLGIHRSVPELWACYMAGFEFGESVWNVLAYFHNRFRSMYPDRKVSECPNVDVFGLVNSLIDNLPETQQLAMVEKLQMELAKKEQGLRFDGKEDSVRAR